MKTLKTFIALLLASILLASCSSSYKPVGMKKKKHRKCDCSRWSYNDRGDSPAGAGSSSNADLYVADFV